MVCATPYHPTALWGSRCSALGAGFIGSGPVNRCLQPQEAQGRGGWGQAAAPLQSPTHFPQGLIGGGGIRMLSTRLWLG